MSKESVDDKFLNPTRFSQEIERLVKSSNGMITYIEAIVTYCQRTMWRLRLSPNSYLNH